jgi:uncharacterized membrane protein YeaQ/YmgE (transglycosylase-associated protein family)
MNNVLKLGLIIGLVSTLLSVIISSFFDPSLYFSGTSILISFALGMIILIVLGRKFLRDPETGTLSYGEALKNLFLASIIGAVVSLVASTALYQNDTRMQEAFQDYAYSAQETGLRMGLSLAGASEAKITEEIDALHDKIDRGEIDMPEYPFTFSKLPLNLFNQVIFSLITALIAGIFVKKKEESYT